MNFKKKNIYHSLNIEHMLASRPLIIAGPCSAESEEQVMETAIALKKMNIPVLRAGIWKPRTRPGQFEGAGTIGLNWLKQAGKSTGMLVSTEVATAKHVQETLKKGIDILWLGARTSANPFAVQEIADALQGVHIPVMIKNPVHPDVYQWLGVIERIEQAVSGPIFAVHRGITSFSPSVYRNNPEWGIALELRKLRPDITFIADPSHIAGKKALLKSVSQTALDLKFDGLMIETHIRPEQALSDAQQQITPDELSVLLAHLEVRKEIPEGIELQTIEELRRTIDFIDEQLIDLFCYRMNIINDIATFKKKNKMTIFQENRWNELLSGHLEKAERKHLNRDFIARLFQLIHQESINKQNELMNEE